jgi:hypothetical protein
LVRIAVRHNATELTSYAGIVNTGYAGSFFVPTIVKELGYTSSMAQVRSIPIFIVATVTAVITAYVSDRIRNRYWLTMLGLVVASTGYIMLLAQNNLSAGVKYFALFLVVPGGYITQPLVLVWMSNLVSGHYKRSVSSAMQVGFGNLGQWPVTSFVPRGANSGRFRRNRGVKRVLQERGAKVSDWIRCESGNAVDLWRCLHGNVLPSQDRE